MKKDKYMDKNESTLEDEYMEKNKLIQDVPENIGNGMNIPSEECAYPQAFLRRVVMMHREMFLEFYESTDFNREFYRIIKHYLLISDIGSKKDFMDSRIFKDNKVLLSSWVYDIKMSALEIEDIIFETWVQENGPVSSKMEKAETKELNTDIILWMADVYVLLSWAYKIPFPCLLCFEPEALYESYKSERFMEITVCDAVKLIYSKHYKPLKEKWQQYLL